MDQQVGKLGVEEEENEDEILEGIQDLERKIFSKWRFNYVIILLLGVLKLIIRQL